MRQVQLNDNGQLATLVSAVEAGESVTILRGARPVAQITPLPEKAEPNAVSRGELERHIALAKFKAMLDKGMDLGGFRIDDRDALYERD